MDKLRYLLDRVQNCRILQELKTNETSKLTHAYPLISLLLVSFTSARGHIYAVQPLRMNRKRCNKQSRKRWQTVWHSSRCLQTVKRPDCFQRTPFRMHRSICTYPLLITTVALNTAFDVLLMNYSVHCFYNWRGKLVITTNCLFLSA